MSPSQRELEKLIQEANQGSLSETDAGRLRRLLHDSPDAVDTYCSYAILESELHRYSHHRNLAPAVTDTYSSPRRQLFTSFAAAAAILLLGAIVLSWIFIKAPEPVISSFTLSPGTLATAGSDEPLREDQLKPGQRITLTQGVVHLVLNNGTEAVIEAPAIFRLSDLDHLNLESGKGWFHVPHAGRGFQVSTPRALITDLGTEFGVITRESQPTQIHVFQGKVHVRSLAAHLTQQELTAGEAVTATSVGRWTPHRADPAVFQRSLPSELPFLHLSFDSIKDGQVPVTGTIANSQPLTATLHQDKATNSLVPGVHGSALKLDGKGGWLGTNWPGISERGPITVSLWLKLAPGTDLGTSAPALAFWGNPTAGWDAKFKLAVCSLNRDRPVTRVSLGSWRADGATPLDDGRWHHLALVYRGVVNDSNPVMQLYLDGQPEPLELIEDAIASKISIDTNSPASLPFELGRYELPKHSPISLDATIDELRITAGALTAEQIRDLSAPPTSE